MAADEGNKEDQFSFTDQGESLGYISLEQARVVAMRTARDQPGDYGRRFSGVGMVFNVVEQEEGEDYYVVTLSLRPQGDFEGTAGQEQFFIEKEGNVAHRQVLSLPKTKRGGFPAVPVIIGVVIVAAIAVAAVVVAGSRGDGTAEDPGIPASSLTAQAEAAVPANPSATPKKASVVSTTPEVVRVSDVVPLGHRLNVAGFQVEPGQTDIRIANGTVQWSAPPVEDGTYPDDYWIDMEAIPDQDGSEIIWTGVDFQNGTDAGVSINNDRFVNVEILPPDILRVPEIADDHGDAPETATEISLGSISGVIENGFDLGFFRFFAEADAEYLVEVYLESHQKIVLVLLDRFGNLVEENDDGEGLYGGSRIIWAAHPTSGEYYLVVKSFDPDVDAGPYTLSVTFISDDHGDSIDNATFISPGSTIGTIDPPSDVDLFGFFARAGESYIVEVVLEGHPDTVLSLYQWPDIQLDVVDDTEGMDGGSRISWTALEDGDYFLEVRSYDPDFQTGSYILYLDLAAAPQDFVSGFYSGTITSFEDGSTAQLELDLGESEGEVFGYLTLYDPHVGSGDIESGSFSKGFLNFTVPAVLGGVSYYCEYFGENLVDEASLAGSYECFRNDGTFFENGEWSAFRQKPPSSSATLLPGLPSADRCSSGPVSPRSPARMF